MNKQRPIQIYNNGKNYYFRFKPPDRYKDVINYSYNRFIIKSILGPSIIFNQQVIDKYNIKAMYPNCNFNIKYYKLLTFQQVIDLYRLMDNNIDVLNLMQLIISKWDDWN